MSIVRIWTIVAAAAIVAVLAGGFFVLVQPQLAAAATSDEAAASTEAQTQTLQMKLIALTKRAAKIESMRAEDAVLLKQVPTILKDNTFNRRMNEVAALNGVEISSLQLGAASAYTAPVAADPGAGASTAAETSPLVTPANFAVVPVSVTVTGTQLSVLQFSTAIQNDERVFLITGATTSRNDGGTVTAVLTGSIYTLAR